MLSKMRMFTTTLVLITFLHLTSFSKGIDGAKNNNNNNNNNNNIIIRCIERERQALLDFKQSLDEDNGVLSSWGNDVHKRECCKWRGVRCNNNTGHVISLDLHGDYYYYSGRQQYLMMRAPKVSSSLVELEYLNYLDLSFNDFQGSLIPEFIGSFQRLRFLNLQNANFGGAIPSQLGNLTNLHTLLLSYNGLNETIAELLGKLATGAGKSSLETLELSGNQLIGELPANMSINFPSLRELHARENLLDGSLSLSSGLPLSLEKLDLSINLLSRIIFHHDKKGFGKASNLMQLDLSYNQITGPFPDLSHFLSLRMLNLSGNQLQGGLSETIGKLSKLQIFRAKSNSLEGVIKEAHFWNLTSLLKLDLSLNQGLWFNISDDWVPPFRLKSIVLANCQIGPQFPKWLRNQTSFSELDLSSANISDAIPNWFWDLISPNLRYLNLSQNTIHDNLPDLSTKISPFSIIDLSFNHFWGPISKFVVRDFIILNLSNNKFVGSVSFLCSIITQKTLSIDLSDNHFSGKVPNCWNNNISNLLVINFANNHFFGEVPHSLGSLPRLQSLHLPNNNLGGELPSSLRNCTSLRVMDLGGNNLSGIVPSWIGTSLPNLTVLSLRNNNFSGSMPQSLCHLKRIHLLDLSHNKVIGRIPPHCFNNFTTLIQNNISYGSTELFYFTVTGDIDYPGFFIDDVLVQWKNKESEYNKQLGFLNCIDLSSNQLTGDIPEELSDLKELVSLNLSRNHFTGKIFETIYQMKKLESLDLSRNQLSGKIPTGLALLTFLAVLDLSNNSLSGRIPKGTQLQTFNPSSYAGNSGLCGDPLPKCLADFPSHSKSNDDYQEAGDDNELLDRGFYISMVLGFSLGFWGLVLSLLLNDSWRFAYYRFFNDVKDWLFMKMKIY